MPCSTAMPSIPGGSVRIISAQPDGLEAAIRLGLIRIGRFCESRSLLQPSLARVILHERTASFPRPLQSAESGSYHFKNRSHTLVAWKSRYHEQERSGLPVSYVKDVPCGLE